MPTATYLLNVAQKRFCRLNGICQSSSMPREKNLCQSFGDHMLYSTDQLPPKVDLREFMTTIEDQSRIGSCVANTLAGAYEYLTKRSSGENVDVSRLFIYYNARTRNTDPEYLEDSGCSMTDAIETLKQFGVCKESMWPYHIERMNDRPDDNCFDEAVNFTIAEALRLDINLDQMKSCLAQGFPFAFGLSLFKSFDQASKTGVVPMPDSSEQSRQSHGSHALLAVGYSDASKSFIVRNSWGQDWGDKGYCYIPYQYMTDPNLCFDVWTIHQIKSDDFGQDGWDNNDDVDYNYVDPDTVEEENNEDGIEIQEFSNEEEIYGLLQDIASKAIGSFFSLGY